MAYEDGNSFSVCFNILKVRYVEMDNILSCSNFLTPTDKVNVFISLETVWKYISMIHDLEKKLFVERDFQKIIIADILNLAGHYKKFFSPSGVTTRIFLYTTDFNSTSEMFKASKYNEDYRSYFLNKFNCNPKFAFLTEELKNTIIPEVKILCEYIPGVHFISSKNIEGSMIPYIIAESDKSYKNIIITGESYDTQYSVRDNFFDLYCKRAINYKMIAYEPDRIISEMTKTELGKDFVSPIISNPSMFTGLLSCLGNRDRSIDGIKGMGFATYQSKILNGIATNKITKQTRSIELIADVFPETMRNDIINNYYCIDVETQYQDLSKAEQYTILNQQTENIDMNSIQKLNSSRFYNHPLNLESLFC